MSVQLKMFRAAAAGCTLCLVLAGTVAGAQSATGQATGQTADTSAQAPDNSGHNKRHRTTADQGSNAAGDREMTAKIRRAIVGDKSLSTYGHNVKIITQDGTVTLKGPVHSDQEKQAIVAKAAEIAGQDKVTDQLTVKQ